MRNSLLIVILFVFSCCSNIAKKTDRSFHKFEKAYNYDFSSFEIIIIIPMEGCGTCIELAKVFYTKNFKNENIAFIFSYYKPFEKELMTLIKQQEMLNTFTDIKCLSQKYALITTSAVAFFLEKGKVIKKADFLTLNANDFEKLGLKVNL